MPSRRLDHLIRESASQAERIRALERHIEEDTEELTDLRREIFELEFRLIEANRRRQLDGRASIGRAVAQLRQMFPGLEIAVSWKEREGERAMKATRACKPNVPKPTHIQIPTFSRLYIPGWHPARLNEMIGRHPMVIARRKKKDRTTLAVWLWGKVIPPPCPRRVRLIIHLAPRQRGGDPDAYWKSLLDSMVHNHLLIDDNRQSVVLGPVEFVRDTETGTTIELYDLEPAKG